MKMTLSICVDEDVVKIIEKAKEKAAKEGKRFNLSKFISPYIEKGCKKYIQEHGDGNPAFTLEQFTDPSMMATPALCRSHQDIREYLEKIRDSGEIWEKIGAQLRLWADTYNRIERQKNWESI